MALIQLIYVSSLVGESESELGSILASSSQNNARDGITGMLLYSQGSFMQVLEGEEDAVNATFARIASDLRHEGLMTLSREPIESRQFGHWSMGFKHVHPTDLAKFPRHAPYFDFRKQSDAIQAEPGLALEMLMLFAKNAL